MYHIVTKRNCHSHKEFNLCIFFPVKANLSTLIQTHYDLPWDLALKIQFVGVFRDSYATMMGSHGQINATIMKVKISLQCLYRIASPRGCIFFFLKNKNAKFCLCSFFFLVFVNYCDSFTSWRRMTSWEWEILMEVVLFFQCVCLGNYHGKYQIHDGGSSRKLFFHRWMQQW